MGAMVAVMVIMTIVGTLTLCVSMYMVDSFRYEEDKRRIATRFCSIAASTACIGVVGLMLSAITVVIVS